MMRALCAVAVLVAATSFSVAADPSPLAGNWKLSLPLKRGEGILLLKFTEKDGMWTGEYVDGSRELGVDKKSLSVTKVKVNGDSVKFALDLKGEGEIMTFDGVLSKDAKKLHGSIASGGRSQVTTMRPSKLAKLDDEFALTRELFDQVEDGALMFALGLEILSHAGAQKLPLADARGIIDRLNKTAGIYGPRWEREVALHLVDILNEQEGLSELAVAQAKRAERLLTDDDTAATRMAVLEAIVNTLTKAGKPDEAKPYVTQLAKLELRDFAEYSKTHPPFKPEAFAGRKAKSDKTAVVELFTGTECTLCAGVELAFDGLLKAYKPSDAICLEYHVHFPNPDPLANPECTDRVGYYGDKIERPPTLFINGKVAADSGGGAASAEKFYKQFRTTIDELLEKPAGVKLALAVTKGEKGAFNAKATVTDLEMPGEKIMLRFVLAEDRIRFAGSNGLRYHHMVVRAMPGGAKGFALTKKSQDQTVTIDPEAIRTALTKYLADFAENKAPFPHADRPLALRNLKLVALVQNDETKVILSAVQVDLSVEK